MISGGTEVLRLRASMVRLTSVDFPDPHLPSIPNTSSVFCGLVDDYLSEMLGHWTEAETVVLRSFDWSVTIHRITPDAMVSLDEKRIENDVSREFFQSILHYRRMSLHGRCNWRRALFMFSRHRNIQRQRRPCVASALALTERSGSRLQSDGVQSSGSESIGANAMPDRLLSTVAVLDRICISKTELYRKINSGEFPRPVPVGRHRVAFLEAEVADWIAARVKAREHGDGADDRRARALKAISARV